MKKQIASCLMIVGLLVSGSAFAQKKQKDQKEEKVQTLRFELNATQLAVIMNGTLDNITALKKAIIPTDEKGNPIKTELPFNIATAEEVESIVSTYNIPRDEVVIAFGYSWKPTVGNTELKDYNGTKWFYVLRGNDKSVPKIIESLEKLNKEGVEYLTKLVQQYVEKYNTELKKKAEDQKNKPLF